jgi:hypothetical protein
MKAQYRQVLVCFETKPETKTNNEKGTLTKIDRQFRNICLSSYVCLYADSNYIRYDL